MFKTLEKKTASGRFKTNREWVELLEYPAYDGAISDLRTLLIRGLKPALYKYVDRDLDQFIEDVAQDALLKILDKLHTFRGESKFLSWAMKIAVREGLSELRRKKWQDISINDLAGPGESEDQAEINTMIVADEDAKPESETHLSMLLATVLEIIEKELPEKQKKALIAVKVHDMPIEVVAKQMGVKRNALYKLLHDARLNMKARMNERGLNPDKVLESM